MQISSTVFVLSGVTLVAANALGDVTIERVAYQNENAPGGGWYTQFLGGFGIGAPVIDQQGRVAFRAFLGGGTPSTDTATFVGWPGSVQRWAREGEVLGGLGNVFGHNSDNQSGFPWVNDGRVGMLGPTSPGLGVIVGLPGSATTIARAGTPAAGLPAGAVYNGFDALALGPGGVVAFVSTINGGGYSFQRAVFSNAAGPLAPVAVYGQPAPGLSGQTFAHFGGVTFNAAGRMAFKGMTLSGHVLYSNHGGSLTPVAWAGMSIPGAGTLSSIGDLMLAPGFNATGHVTFKANLTSGVTAVVTNRSGTFQHLAVQGMAIPGVAGSQFNSLTLMSPPAFNDTGDVAFACEGWFQGFNHDLVFVSRSGGSAMVAREGLASPIDPSVTYAAIDTTSVRMNNLGQVVFISTISGPGVTGANDRAIFAQETPTGPLVVALREGQAIDIFGDGSMIRTVASFEWSQPQGALLDPAGGTASGAGAINDFGALGVLINFTDGTQGIFRVTIAPTLTCDADVNGDGSVNGLDVECQELAVGGDFSCYAPADADFNQDGAVNGGDVEAVELVMGGGPCP
ncbi:MAG: hypothetical protein HBSAPP03_10190 [Phycisphaerae bacterium]|nr:MAG: hypothetical protein HBSAPP03_10190 [Phycisphaerae bacterium]